MTAQQKLLRRLSALQFALWELHLYLDTHPSDLQAASMHAKHEKQLTELKAEYESRFGPLSPPKIEGADWLKNPWPWDVEGGEA